MLWILAALIPPLAGLLAAALLMPKNRGKKEPPPRFVVAYSTRTRVCLCCAMAGMTAVLCGTALLDVSILQKYAVFYIFYTFLIGLLVAMLVTVCTYYIEVEGDSLLIHRRTGKPKLCRAGQIDRLDVRKYDLRVCDSEGSTLFTLGMQMENLDLFLAWAHARPRIGLSLNGRELKKKG